jgi:CBS-domain-containing membrane protein
MSTPPPEPISHTAEMVIATVVGVAVGLGMDNLLLGCGVGIALGILLSIGRTLYVDRQRRRR